MKRFLLFFCYGAFVVSCNNDTKVKTAEASTMNTDLVQQNLKGKVKSITETSITIDSTGKQKPDSLTRVTDFDEKGYQTVSLQKNGSGNVVSEDFVSRRPDGVVTEFGTKKNGKPYSRVVTEIDKEGKYVGGQSYDSTGKQDGYFKDLSQNEYSIVYAGKHYGMNDKIKESWDNKFDKNHFLGGKSTDSTGKTTYEGTAKVNDKGDMSEEDYTYVENGQSKHEKNSFKYDAYDDKGNWTQRTTLNAQGKPTKVFKRVISYYSN